MRDFHKRSIVKALCWRFSTTFVTIAIVYIFTRKPVISLGVGVTEVFVKIILYYIHERIWERISWGKLTHPLAGLAVSRELEPEHLEEIRKHLEDLGYF
jgi:uncharacterized membrane protein